MSSKEDHVQEDATPILEPSTYADLAIAYAEMGSLDDAIEAIRAGLARYPEAPVLVKMREDARFRDAFASR